MRGAPFGGAEEAQGGDPVAIRVYHERRHLMEVSFSRALSRGYARNRLH
jgi:hypothetical protein